MITLILDTSDIDLIRVELVFGDKKESIVRRRKAVKSQEALFLIDKLLKKKNLSLGDIQRIEVKTQAGSSFTGLRVGIAIANALGFALQVPVNGKINTIALPIYRDKKEKDLL